jgi:hypothetical protein
MMEKKGGENWKSNFAISREEYTKFKCIVVIINDALSGESSLYWLGPF